MDSLQKEFLEQYEKASRMEWLAADEVGGVSASSVLNANTRKQHALLAVGEEDGTRTALVSHLEETFQSAGHTYDLATNAYLDTVHPAGFHWLESFQTAPWPTWRYRFDGAVLEKQVIVCRGEHTVIVRYRLLEAEAAGHLTIRPFLAFRGHNSVRSEKDGYPSNWRVHRDLVECNPFEAGPTLYISHSDAQVTTLGLWYWRYLYPRDRESGLECIEDLYHPGFFEKDLQVGETFELAFSSPSPQLAESLKYHVAREEKRVASFEEIAGLKMDETAQALLRSADDFVYESWDGGVKLHPGLPWGENEVYRGLLAFPGILLTPHRFDFAERFLDGLARRWQAAPSLLSFEPQVADGQMHPADVPLWFVVAAWRYVQFSGNVAFVLDTLRPTLAAIVKAYEEGDEVHCTPEGLIQLNSPDTGAPPRIPLGTNALWYCALHMMADLCDRDRRGEASRLRGAADGVREAMLEFFACHGRAGLADAVGVSDHFIDESVRVSQVLTVGLPYPLVLEAAPVLDLIREHLLTPFGLRTLSNRDGRYVGDGRDVGLLPKVWSGSVDPTWTGLYCDALRRAAPEADLSGLFAPVHSMLYQRGFGHVSGAFWGEPPFTPCDFVASASATGEILRVYVREVLGQKGNNSL